MQRINPYLTFAGNCRQAMNFYKACIGGELSVIVVGESPVAGQVPANMQQQLLHAHLITGNVEIMATDMRPVPMQPGNDVHLCLICNDEAELRHLFSLLVEGGNINQPIQKMFFGWIGVLTDQFGKRWILECGEEAA
ncbi:MAG: hypothetical protein RL172_58 [Bacteroidota bacterium]|jgi:PhnB protein